MVKDDLGLISREHTLYFKPTIDQIDQQKARKIRRNEWSSHQFSSRFSERNATSQFSVMVQTVDRIALVQPGKSLVYENQWDIYTKLHCVSINGQKYIQNHYLWNHNLGKDCSCWSNFALIKLYYIILLSCRPASIKALWLCNQFKSIKFSLLIWKTV
jgi:hypothetical protein